MKRKVQYFQKNESGRDFVVGDLHGCYDEFVKLLEHVGFDKTKDRVFSVGDLVDRGPKNLECAQLLDNDWFFATKGNHEELMYESILNESSPHIGTWVGNGGAWYSDYWRDEAGRKELIRLSELMQDLPLVIAVGQGKDRFNVVHAELYYEGTVEIAGQVIHRRIPVTDSMIDIWVWKEHEEGMMTWGRTIISGSKVANHKWHDDKNMSLTFCGHTPVRDPVQFGQQMYIDLGGVFYHYSGSKSHDNAIVLVEPAKKKLYRHGMVMGFISEHDVDLVEKWAM